MTAIEDIEDTYRSIDNIVSGIYQKNSLNEKDNKFFNEIINDVFNNAFKIIDNNKNIYDKNIWSKKAHEYIDTLNDPNIISLARQLYYKKNNDDIYYFEYNSINYNLLNTLKYNDNLFEVMDINKTNIYYKFVLDIDYKNEDGNDMIDIIKNIIYETINYFIEHYNIFMNKKYIFVSSSCGWKSEKHFKVSYHIVFSVVMLWKDYKLLYEDIEQKIFKKYNIKYCNGFIDHTITISKKNLRMLYQSKKNSDRVKKPLWVDDEFGYSEKLEDHLVGCYGNTKDRYTIFTYNDDKYKKSRELIENANINIIKSTINDNYISNRKLSERFLLDYDFVKCLLFNIYNDIKIITYELWYEIITLVYSYSTSISKEELKQHYSNMYSILYNTRTNYYLSICIEWTLSGYKKDRQNNFINHHINHLNKIWNYLNHKNKNNRYIKVNHKALTKLIRLSSIYNKHIVQKWDIHNIIPRNINLENQDFLNIQPYPSFGDKSVYKLLNANNPYIAMFAFMANGKSAHIINMIIKYPHKRILILTPRETLTNAHFSRFNKALPSTMNFIRYKHKSKIINKSSFGDYDLTKNFICSYESAWKLPINAKYDIIILDEIEALSSSMLSATSKTNGLFIERFRTFFNLIQNCVANKGNVIFAEAMNSSTNICLMKHLLQDNQKILTLQTKDIRFYQKYVLYSHHKSRTSIYVMTHFLQELFKDLNNGKRISALVISKEFLIDIKNQCTIKNIKCVIIHADNKNEMEKYINNPSLIEQENIQFLGWTTSISVGFSEEAVDYWDFKYMYINNFGRITKSCVSANTILQSNFRSRYVKEYHNDYYFIDNNYYDNDTNILLEFENIINNHYWHNTENNIKYQITKVFIADLINDRHNLTLNNSYISKLTDETFIIDEKHQTVLTDKYNINNNDYINIHNIIKYEDNVKNKLMLKNEILIEGESVFTYKEIDNDTITYYVKTNDYNRYQALGLLLNDIEMMMIKDLMINDDIKLTTSKKYIAETLKCMVEKQGFIWDDINTKRSYRKPKEIKSIEVKSNEDVKSNDVNLNDYVIPIEEVKSIEEVKRIEKQYSNMTFPPEVCKYIDQFLKDIILHNITVYDLLSKKNSFGDPFYGDDNDIVKKTLNIINILLKYTNLNNIQNTLYDKNSIECWGAVFSLLYNSPEFFKLLTTFKKYYYDKSYKNNNIDNDVIVVTNNIIDKIFLLFNVSNDNPNNLFNTSITSTIIKENENIINEMYNDYIIKNKLKGIRKERVNKVITKLIFLLEDILYITLSSGEQKSIKNKETKKVSSYYKYKLIPLEIKTLNGCQSVDVIYDIFVKSKRSYNEYDNWFEENETDDDNKIAYYPIYKRVKCWGDYKYKSDTWTIGSSETLEIDRYEYFKYTLATDTYFRIDEDEYDNYKDKKNIIINEIKRVRNDDKTIDYSINNDIIKICLYKHITKKNIIIDEYDNTKNYEELNE